MKIGIIGAMEEEIRRLRDAMENVEVHQLYGKKVFEGWLDDQAVVLVQCGIGKVNAAISVTLLVEHFKVTHVINTGTAGAIDPGLKIGDIVIAQSATFHDVDVTAFGYLPGQMAGMPATYHSDLEMMRLAQTAARELSVEPILGEIVSGDQFINGQNFQAMILDKFPKARACEMESAAIAQACFVLGIPFVIIRCMSDQADGQANVDFDSFVIEAGQKSAVLVEKMLMSMN